MTGVVGENNPFFRNTLRFAVNMPFNIELSRHYPTKSVKFLYTFFSPFHAWVPAHPPLSEFIRFDLRSIAVYLLF
jgi:hypothetical protein